MALADIPGVEHSKRLDSWKEIADYLRRDVRTAARWESQGLPLHRVPGGKGRSVYALTAEIDRWLAGRPAEADAGPPSDTVAPEAPLDPQVVTRPRSRFRSIVISAACIIAAIAIAGTTMWRRATRSIDFATAHATTTNADVSITDGSGGSRVVFRFDPDDLPTPPLRSDTLITDLDADGTPEILTGIGYYTASRSRMVSRGELLNLATTGWVRWRFAFDDTLTFTDSTYSGSWILSDWQVEPAAAPARVAVVAHHYTWWPSMVAVLDSAGRRLGTFVNPGWMESVLWLDHDHLVIGGFNNVRDEAMLALVDTAHVDGQAPGSNGTAFACKACPPAPPLFYATFARSELNRLTAGRFNRAQVSATDTQILVTTSETRREQSDTNAMYEFDRDLRFLRARYSDRYWDEHRRLEMEGRLTHSRETCPERDPPAIHIWSAARGWTRTTPVGR